jgi:hypothetical protein
MRDKRERVLRRRRVRKRFDRQFEAIAKLHPKLRLVIGVLRANGWKLVRIPAAVLLTLGGLAWFLPLLGLWMLPAGLLLLAVDLPFMRKPVSAMMIRARRRLSVWMRYWRGRAAVPPA